MRLHYLRAIGFALIAACLTPVLTGCASSRTSHTAREQLLLSNAVDQSLDKQGFIGIPAFGLPGMPLDLPEVKLITQETQSGVVKLAFVACDAKTGIALGQGGTSIARANEDSWYVLGVGPFLEGSISDEVRHATGSNDSLPSPYELIADAKAEPCPQFISLVDEERGSVPRIASETPDSLAR